MSEMVQVASVVTQESTSFPKSVFFIILNEFCERFSFYGLRTILIIYLTQFIQMSDNSATACFHGFTMLCYFTPILGALLADGYIGLYRTIVSISFVYLAGELILCLTSMKPLGAPNLWGVSIGLILIALGTGGIKPCVSAFGANQFSLGQQKYLVTFFSLFYFSINLGSVLSTIVTPILRGDVKCFGNECYPLAFGVPTALMATSIILIIIGRPFFKVDQPKTQNENIFKKVFGCILHGLRQKLTQQTVKKHWLDYASDEYPQEFISDVKKFIRVLIMFIPIPVFWALFDQQGSRWTLQAQKLNQQVTNSFAIKADQIQSINPVLILVLIPVFNWIVYPMMNNCNLCTTPLKRMTLGMFFAAFAFVISAALEFRIQNNFVRDNPKNVASIINLTPCQMDLTKTKIIEPYSLEKILHGGINGSFKCFNSSRTINFETNINTNLILTIDESMENVSLIKLEGFMDRQPIGLGEIRFVKINKNKFEATLENERTALGNFQVEFTTNLSINGYKRVEPDKYMLLLHDLTSNSSLTRQIQIDNGVRETFLIYNRNDSIDFIRIIDLARYELSFAYQLIQYVVITVGEILFSINGLSFAYSEAPESMKSILQASWLLTVAFGNLIVLIIAEANMLTNQAHEYLLFASLMFVTMVVFAIMAYFYQSTDNDTTGKDEKFTSLNSKDNFSSNVELVKMAIIEENKQTF